MLYYVCLMRHSEYNANTFRELRNIKENRWIAEFTTTYTTYIPLHFCGVEKYKTVL